MLDKLFNLENKQGVMGMNARNIELVYPNNDKEDYDLADDKVIAKKILHENDISCAETYAVIERMSKIKETWNKLSEDKDAIVIKPSNGFGGDGIKILIKGDDGSWMESGEKIETAQIHAHINQIIAGFYSRGNGDKAILEACITPHPFFAEIYDSVVPDFRVITLDNKPILAMLRMPTSYSNGKANLHQDGVGIGVDMETAILTQVYDGTDYSDCHPDNSESVNGKKIPYWKEMVELSIETSKCFPLDFLGIDIVIDKDAGPMIMEVNVRPGLGIQMVNKIGLKKAVEEYCTDRNDDYLLKQLAQNDASGDENESSAKL